MSRARVFLLLGTALLAFVGPQASTRVTVGAEQDLRGVVASVPEGTTLVLRPGVHRGPVTLTRTVHLVGEEGAQLVASAGADAALTVKADDVRVEGIEVGGGSSGIVVREVEGVVLRDLDVRNVLLHGIEVVDAAAHVDSVAVTGLRHELAQGIEVRNSDGRPDTVVEGSFVEGGQEGIVSHVSEVVFRDNTVRGTTLRGITVTEMSDGWVSGNEVAEAVGAGLYCGDMSRCDFRANRAVDIGAQDGGTSTAGWGLVVTYHARAFADGNSLDGAAGAMLTSLHGSLSSRSPLDPGSVSDIAFPAAVAAGATVALCALALLAGRRIVPRLRAAGGRGGELAVGAFVVALVVQSFHMFEHGLQVYRVYVDHVPSRGGLAGPGVEAEWVHLAYNLALLLLVCGVAARGMGRRLQPARVALVAAAAVQGWHTVEHVAKVVQHVGTGAKVNPGLVGGFFDLVWFHFTLNLAVYLLCLLCAGAWLRSVLARAGRRLPLPAARA